MRSFGQIDRAIRFKLLSKEDKARVGALLFGAVEDGELVEHFFKSPIWQKIISPWLKAEEDTADRHLRDFTHDFAEDEAGFWERGKIRLKEDFLSMLNEKLALKEQAQQKMLELQVTGEKDAGRKNS